jgi:hypothetical protein
MHVILQASMPLQRVSQAWYACIQSDWQVNAKAAFGLAAIIKIITRILSIVMRIPALP